MLFFLFLSLNPWLAFQDVHGSGGADRIEPGYDYRLILGGAEFDPLLEAPPIPAAWQSPPRPDADFHLIQFQGPTRGSWLDAVKSEQLKIVRYIYPFTYVVWGRPADLSRAEAGHAFVRWSGPFEAAYRVLPRWRFLSETPVPVALLIYSGADLDAIRAGLLSLGAAGIRTRPIDAQFEVWALDLPGDRFQDAAKIAGVYSIQPKPTDGGTRGERSNQVNVNQVDMNQQAFPGYQTWLAGVGLSGAGIVIANVDSGVDQNHPDLVNRFLPCTGDTCGGGASSGHGTHTAGIMAADGASGALDGFGFLRGLGVAPGASMVEQVYNPTFLQPGGMLTLMLESFRNGAQLSGNSWGPAGSPMGYDNDTMQVDIGVRDVDPDVPGNQPFSYVLSIMNGFGGFQSQGTPDEAKNIFGVGSTFMQLPDGTQFEDINSVSSNSAHGPALDGRLLPLIVAPGRFVDSTDPGSGYQFRSGTSMASPHVSGAVALFIEYYRALTADRGGADPSPALIKAAFLPVAIDLAGHMDADGKPLGHRFDSKQGWGRMDLEAVVDPQVDVLYFDNPQIFENTGESWQQVVAVDDPSKPVKMMLVWTDAPGHGLGGATPAWNNDLDLEVTYGGATFLGNAFGPDGWSVDGGVADFANNTEGVLIGPTASGLITIEVNAVNLNSDGIPNSGGVTDQDFSLVCYNCDSEPSFLVSPNQNLAEVCAGDDAVFELQVTPTLDFGESISLSAVGLPAGLNANFSQNPLLPPGMTTLTISNTQDIAAGSYPFQVQAVSASQNKSLDLELTLFSALPGAPSLSAPADMALNQSLAPAFAWNAAAQAGSYAFELSRDAGFTDLVYSTALVGTMLTLPRTLEVDREYFWRVRATNPCGTGPISPAFQFRTTAEPPLLLVDDDDNQPDSRSAYTDVLDQLGLTYSVWDTAGGVNEPEAADMAPYPLVIWFSGGSTGNPPLAGPGIDGETALAAYLDGGGCLLLSSQSYLFDRGGMGADLPTAFMSDYLGVGSGTSDSGQTTMMGEGPIFGGVGFHNLTFPFANRSDRLSPNANGALAFSGDRGDGAVQREGLTYHAAYLGFPMEALPLNARIDTLQAMLQWCGAPTEGGCTEMADLLGKYPQWPAGQTVLDLIQCLNLFEQP